MGKTPRLNRTAAGRAGARGPGPPGGWAHALRGELAVVVANLDFALAGARQGGVDDALREARAAAERVRASLLGLGTENDASAASSSRAPRSPAQGREPEPARAPRVLVVDDEPLMGLAVRRLLRDCDVVACTSGAEAVAQLAAGERFDVVLCDLVMPQMSGLDVFEEVRRVAPDHVGRLVFVTAGATSPGLSRFLDTIDNPVTAKPFDIDALRALVRSISACG